MLCVCLTLHIHHALQQRLLLLQILGRALRLVHRSNLSVSSRRCRQIFTCVCVSQAVKREQEAKKKWEELYREIDTKGKAAEEMRRETMVNAKR